MLTGSVPVFQAALAAGNTGLDNLEQLDGTGAGAQLEIRPLCGDQAHRRGPAFAAIPSGNPAVTEKFEPALVEQVLAAKVIHNLLDGGRHGGGRLPFEQSCFVRSDL